MSAISPLVIVMPVFEDVEASSRLFREIARSRDGADTFIVAVDDGSVRQPVDPAAISAAGLDGVVVRLRRNVGHQRAIAIGLSYVAEQFEDAVVVVMDSDGEDTPQSISELIVGLESDDVDVVVATRKSRVETLKFRAFYAIYKHVFSMLSGRKISFGNFMAAKMPAVRRLAAMQEVWVHVAASVLTSKLRVATCALDRGPRYAGRSKMNFVGLALHGFRALMVFAEDVLVRVGIACTFVAGLSVLGGVLALILKTIGFATPGWFSLVTGILMIVFLQTGALTLIILMLAGLVRSGGVLLPGSYREFVAEVLHARPR